MHNIAHCWAKCFFIIPNVVYKKVMVVSKSMDHGKLSYLEQHDLEFPAPCLDSVRFTLLRSEGKDVNGPPWFLIL